MRTVNEELGKLYALVNNAHYMHISREACTQPFDQSETLKMMSKYLKEGFEFNADWKNPLSIAQIFHNAAVKIQRQNNNIVFSDKLLVTALDYNLDEKIEQALNSPIKHLNGELLDRNLKLNYICACLSNVYEKNSILDKPARIEDVVADVCNKFLQTPVIV